MARGADLGPNSRVDPAGRFNREERPRTGVPRMRHGSPHGGERKTPRRRSRRHRRP